MKQFWRNLKSIFFLKYSVEELEDNYSLAMIKIGNLETELLNSVKTIKSLQDELAQQIDKTSSLQNEYNFEKIKFDQIFALKDEILELKEEKKELQRQIEKNEFASSQRDGNAILNYQKKNKDLEDRNKALEYRNKDLELRNQLNIDKIHDLTNKNKRLRRKIKELKNENI